MVRCCRPEKFAMSADAQKKQQQYNTVKCAICCCHTWFKTLRPPRAETWGFGGQNKEKDGNEDGYCGVRHKPEIVASNEWSEWDFLSENNNIRRYVYTHSASELKVCVAQPVTKPGSLVNHMTTSRMKRPRTLISPNVMGPSRRCCSRITL